MAERLRLDDYFYIILAKFRMCSVFLQIHILTVEKRVCIVCCLSAQARKCRHAHNNGNIRLYPFKVEAVVACTQYLFMNLSCPREGGGEEEGEA